MTNLLNFIICLRGGGGVKTGKVEYKERQGVVKSRQGDIKRLGRGVKIKAGGEKDRQEAVKRRQGDIKRLGRGVKRKAREGE
jgi:hypothetical protein